jgi:hypothetical protein
LEALVRMVEAFLCSKSTASSWSWGRGAASAAATVASVASAWPPTTPGRDVYTFSCGLVAWDPAGSSSCRVLMSPDRAGTGSRSATRAGSLRSRCPSLLMLGLHIAPGVGYAGHSVQQRACQRTVAFPGKMDRIRGPVVLHSGGCFEDILSLALQQDDGAQHSKILANFLL